MKKKIVRYEVETWNRKRYRVKTVLAEHRDTDVAVAAADLPAGVTVPYLKFALKPPRLAQQIVVIGNPTRLTWTVSGGDCFRNSTEFQSRSDKEERLEDQNER